LPWIWRGAIRESLRHYLRALLRGGLGSEGRGMGYANVQSRGYAMCAKMAIPSVRARNCEQAQSAFTLVEMMIVVGVVALLAAIAVPSMAHARETSLTTRMASDLRVARDAFTQYAADNGQYPLDTMPGIIPDGMGDYLRRLPWRDTTPIGGQWDWDYDRFGVKAGVSVYEPTAPLAQMQRLDAMIDDGNLSAGAFHARSQGYISVIED
jgi:prepilin-type N-terminal cleavage/methylation domain-containing protein